MARLKNRTAVVTGASKGIGAEIAKHLAAEGARVVVNYASNPAAAQQVVNEIRKGGGEAIAVKADVTSAAQVKTLFDEAQAAFGTATILVNNAGAYGATPLGTIDEASFRKYFDLNVLGLLLATQEAAGRFNGAPGVIINISSTVGITPAAPMSIYSATKAAVDNLTRSLALELGPRARVVAVSPGLTITEGFQEMTQGGDGSFEQYAVSRTPLARTGKPADIARVVTFLASDEAAWITGETVQAGGGVRM